MDTRACKKAEWVREEMGGWEIRDVTGCGRWGVAAEFRMVVLSWEEEGFVFKSGKCLKIFPGS